MSVAELQRTFSLDGRFAVHRPFRLDLFLRLASFDLDPVDQRSVVVCGGGNLFGTAPRVVDDEFELVGAGGQAEDGVEVVCAVSSVHAISVCLSGRSPVHFL